MKTTRRISREHTRLPLLAIPLLILLMIGCETTQRMNTPTLPSNPFESLYLSVGSPDQALWWPLLFSGFLAIAAGLVNSFIFGKGLKLFFLGIILASIPPIADYTLRQSALIISLTVLAASIMLVVWVGGKWFGWRDGSIELAKELKPIAQNIKDKNCTPEEAAAIIETAVLTRPRNISKKLNQGESS